MEHTTCLIAGGGPAGIMLGLLLARGGVEVTVLEKHGDFLRDFRGDTVHPSTVRLMDELGIGAEFRALPQSRLENLAVPGRKGETVVLGDFAALPAPYNYVAMIPQWDLLDFLVGVAKREPTFHIRMNTEVTGLVEQGRRITGARFRGTDGIEGEFGADLVVACDGRRSTLRRAAGLVPKDFAVPFDIWWFRMPRHPSERDETGSILPRISGDEILLSLTRDTYYQFAYFLQKGADARLRAEGIERFRERVAAIRPDFADRVHTITSWDEVSLLSVTLDRLRTWHRDGLLCIGDAAHAMSPMGGVGINLAIQDAVAAATLLAGPLASGTLTTRHLTSVRRRRNFPTVVIQGLQRALHRGLVAAVLSGHRAEVPAPMLWLARTFRFVRSIPPRLVGFGPRPEHVPAFARRAPG